MDNGISDMSHLLSVEVEGFKFAVELGKDAVKFLQRLVAIFSNALKWGMIDKSWRYFKESGKTNSFNVRKLHASDGTSTVPISNAYYDAWKKFAKKYGIVYCKLPGANKNTFNVMIGNNDAPLIKLFEDICKEKLTREQARKGAKLSSTSESHAQDMEKVDAEIVYEPPHVKSWTEYMYDNGFMDCSQEEFDDILRETYGEQCTTLTQFIDNAMEGADPEAQKKRNAEIFEKCRIEDLSKESRAGAVTLSFEKKQFAGYDVQKQVAFFQIVKKPARWMGIPIERLIRTKDNGFTAVLNDQSHVTINDIAFDEREPNGYRFEPKEELNFKQIRELDRSWRDSVASERIVARKATKMIEDQKQQVQTTAVTLVNSRGGRKR